MFNFIVISMANYSVIQIKNPFCGLYKNIQHNKKGDRPSGLHLKVTLVTFFPPIYFDANKTFVTLFITMSSFQNFS